MVSLATEEAVVSLPGDLVVTACVNLVVVTGLGSAAAAIAGPDDSVVCRASAYVFPFEVLSRVGDCTSEDVIATGIRSVINP